MATFVNKLKNWMGADAYEDDYLYEEESYAAAPASVEDPVTMPTETRTPVRRQNLKVLDHPNSASMAQVVVIEPRAFEEALDIIEHLKIRKAVILNLHLLDTAQSQRVVDFLSGATHAIEGNQQRIGDGVFIFTPSNVSVASDEVTQEGLSLSDAYWNTAN